MNPSFVTAAAAITVRISVVANDDVTLDDVTLSSDAVVIATCSPLKPETNGDVKTSREASEMESPTAEAAVVTMVEPASRSTQQPAIQAIAK